MSNKTTAAESIRRLALQYKDMVEVADFLEKAGSLETITAEAKKAAADAVIERDAALADLKQANADLDLVKEQANVIADAMNESAKQAAEIDKAAAKEMFDQAKIKADEILAKAQAKADEIDDRAKKAGEVFAAEVETRRQVLAELDKRTAEANKAAETAQWRLESVQASIRKLAEA